MAIRFTAPIWVIKIGATKVNNNIAMVGTLWVKIPDWAVKDSKRAVKQGESFLLEVVG